MATKKKMLMSAAGAAGGAGLDIDEVFSTYLYTGNGSTQTITNGIDLDGEGGIVWTKSRSDTGDHNLFFENGSNIDLVKPNNTDSASLNMGQYGVSFNSNGFSMAGLFAPDTVDIASWTFRKAPKFFDVGTISFDGSGVGSYSHNLGSVPGMVILKLTNTTGDWFVWHKDLTSQNYAMFLNATAASSNQGGWATYTDTTVSFDSSVFANDTAVVYVFAHNDGDGGFGPDGNQDIIKCGSFTPDGSENATIDLGFEPQWFLVKSATGSGSWLLYDNMRGMTASGSADYYLLPNSSSAEGTGSYIAVTPTGIDWSGTGAGNTFIYMAIRRGPLAAPESATEVFDVYTGSDAYPTVITTGFTADSLLGALRSGNSNNFISGSRLTGSKSLKTSSTDAQGNGLFSGTTNACFMRNDGILPSTFGQSNTVYYTWKRAPGYFDVVAYTGDGTGSRVISHNLGVEPELIISKRRSGTRSWFTQAPGPLGYASLLYLDSTDAASSVGVQYGMSTASADTFTTGTSGSFVNSSGDNFITYLFASLPGISKVGSYTGNGTSQTIDCGFTSGARFILIRRTDATGDWFVFDTERGIVSGNDPSLALNNTNAERTTEDSVDPNSSGFIVVDDAQNELNVSNSNYIFYAIA